MLSKNIHASPALCSSEELHTRGFTKHNSSKWNSSVFLPAFLIPLLPQMRDLLFRLIKIRTFFFCRSYLRMQSCRRRVQEKNPPEMFFHNVTITFPRSCAEDREPVRETLDSLGQAANYPPIWQRGWITKFKANNGRINISRNGSNCDNWNSYRACIMCTVGGPGGKGAERVCFGGLSVRVLAGRACVLFRNVELFERERENCSSGFGVLRLKKQRSLAQKTQISLPAVILILWTRVIFIHLYIHSSSPNFLFQIFSNWFVIEQGIFRYSFLFLFYFGLNKISFKKQFKGQY